MISSWEMLARTLNEAKLPLQFEQAELNAIRFAVSRVITRRLNEGADPWKMAGLMLEANPDLSTFVTGLDDDDLALLRSFEREYNQEMQRRSRQPGFMGQAKQMKVEPVRGNSGNTVGFSPNMWAAIRDDIAANPGAYTRFFMTSSENPMERVQKLIQKIELKLPRGHERRQGTPAEQPGGKPSDMTPTMAKVSGLSQDKEAAGILGGRAAPPRASSTPSRVLPTQTIDMDNIPDGDPLEIDVDALKRAHGSGQASRVHAQDVESMKGSSRAVATVQDPSKQKKTADMEDPSQWDLDEADKKLRQMLEDMNEMFDGRRH